MNKNLTLVLILFLAIFLVSNVSASFAKLSYEDTYKNVSGKLAKDIYPRAVISDWYGLFGTKQTIEVIDPDNDCISFCKAKINVTLSDSLQNPLSELKLVNVTGGEINRSQKIEEIYLETYNITIQDFRNNCTNKTIKVGVNKSKTGYVQTTCKLIKNGTHNETRIREVIIPYNPMKVYSKGEYHFYVSAIKNPSERADWQVSSMGQTADRLAWFNTTWLYKKTITPTGVISVNQTINFTIVRPAGMNVTYGDLRFINSTGSNLSYFIVTANSTEAHVFVRPLSNASFDMYYGATGTNNESNYASIFTTTSHGYNLGTAQGAGFHSGEGINISLTSDIIVSKVTKQSTTTAPNCSIGKYSDTVYLDVNISNTPFIGDSCYPNYPVLTKSFIYWVEAYSNLPGSYVQSYVGSINHPFTSLGFNWVSSDIGGTHYSGYILDIVSMDITQYSTGTTVAFGTEETNGDTTKPVVLFNYQSPVDITSIDTLGTGVNITYNISDETALNLSTIGLYFKFNSTTRNSICFINGSVCPDWQLQNYNYNNSLVFNWHLLDNDIYPATYNIDTDVNDLMPHNLQQLTAVNEYVSTEFLNVTTTTQYNFFEIMSNSTASQRLYYCNSTYDFATNTPATSSRCSQISTIPANQPYNHTHTNYSKHQVVTFFINTTTGTTTGGVKVTPTSYFILRGNSGTANVVNYYTISQNARLGAIKTTSNGNTWVNQTYTTDAHLHQFSGNSSLYYYVCANDTSNNSQCSSIRTDLYELAGLPPTTPRISSPVNSTYSGNVSINYSASFSPNGYDINNYNITLWNAVGTFNKTINATNGVNLGFIWDSSSTVSGAFYIEVRVNDSFNQQSFEQSAIFSLNNEILSLNITTPLNISYNMNVSELNYTFNKEGNCWYSRDGGITNSTINVAGVNFTGVNSLAGSNTWTLFCNDTSNVLSNASVTFYLNKLWYNSASSINAFRITQFINRSGSSFTLGGVPYKLIGADSYYLADYATNHTYDDDGNEINGSREHVLEILNEAHYLGINVIRTWCGMSGGGTSTNWAYCPTIVNSTSCYVPYPGNNQGGHTNLFEIGIPGNYSEEMFASMDWVLSEASKRDIRLQLVLINNWDDYGGMNWYLHQSTTVNQTFQNITDNSLDSWWTYHDQFYTDNNSLQFFKNYINYTLNRNNTITGIMYKNDPTIFSWMLVNEPRAKTDGRKRGLIKNFTTNLTAYIKNIDSKHLVTLGIEGLGYNETWGEGTDVFSDQNGTGVDYATFALHPDHWDYFALRGETNLDQDWLCTTTGASCNMGVQKYLNFWVSGSNYTYNNRYSSSYTKADYLPLQPRHSYDNWVTQNVKWANQLGLPVLLQEMSIGHQYTDIMKNYAYNNTIRNFFSNGGDGLMYWTLNHDNYYYSTQNSSVAGAMDDGYGFYVSDDPVLKSYSASTISSFNVVKIDNSGTSWINSLNNFGYDFTVNVDVPSNSTINNCTLSLNIFNGSFYNYTEINSSTVLPNEDYIFTHQFVSTDKNVTWQTQCCADNNCFNSTPELILLGGTSPVVTLISPTNNSYTNNTINLNYNVTAGLDISHCELYINNLLNSTDTTVSLDITQTFAKIFSTTTANYSWYIKCTDIGDNIGTSEIRNFLVDATNPNATLVLPGNNTYTNNTNVNFTATLSDDVGIKNYTVNIYNSTNVLVNSTTIITTTNPLTLAVGIIVTLTDEVYHWFYELFDLAGNHFVTGNNTVTLDATTPLINWTLGVANHGEFLSQNTIFFNVTSSDTNCRYIRHQYRLIGSGTWLGVEYNSCTADKLFYTTSTLSDGHYEYYSQAEDLANNINTTVYKNITLDTILPSLNITVPLSNSYWNYTSFDINYTVNDTNLAKCVWSNNSGLTNHSIICGVNITAITWDEGLNTVKIWANDSAQNVNSKSVSFTVDTVNPLINFTYPTPNSSSVITANNFIVNLSTTESNLNSIIIRLFNSANSLVDSSVKTSNNPSVSFSGLADGVYFYNATMSDLAGHTNLTETRNVTISTSGTIIPPLGGGGSGGNPNYNTGLTNISSYLCEKTYLKDTTQINNIIGIIKLEKGETHSFTEIESYITNWQQVCSDKLNITLNPQFVCSKLYYFLLDTKGKYSVDNLSKLKNNIDSTIKISLNLLDFYAHNYNSRCYDTGYSGKISYQIKESTINLKNTEVCNYSNRIDFFNYYVPLGRWSISDGLSCKTVSNLKPFFKLEKIEDYYYFNGIRLSVVLFIGLIVGFWMYSNRKSKRIAQA
jgi:endo-1,4-beta-mannosidase